MMGLDWLGVLALRAWARFWVEMSNEPKGLGPQRLKLVVYAGPGRWAVFLSTSFSIPKSFR